MGEELDREHDALAKSHTDIAEGQIRVDQQVALTLHMQAKGLDFGEGERLLGLLRETLEQWRLHQTLIEKRVAYLEQQETGRAAAVSTPRPEDTR